MAGVIITRVQAAAERQCEKGHAIGAGDYYCHVDLAPGQERRGGDWGYLERYCTPCAKTKYARFRRILAKLCLYPSQEDPGAWLRPGGPPTAGSPPF
ncbi:hypothetical protein [Arthrobacter sp. A2-55]|uniref:hypothetical protein n=1 Tax=Arthrobacter sp. A2-55 TaxID=2897337 RepID=UPI0021CD70A7|nr:hypothetical protein [Arthrobacter sp. A2-55]MCU6480489.1 hypothetical protein [Arthrobacter sp. A2-55]